MAMISTSRSALTLLLLTGAALSAGAVANPGVSEDFRLPSTERLAHLTRELEIAEVSGMQPRPASTFTQSEYATFSGIGAIVCAVDGKQSIATAFLVGGFDIAVTVSHTFERSGTWATPADCTYVSATRSGEIRERIPLKSITAQWQSEPATFGHVESDFAVVRLARPVKSARRTMPLTRFASRGAPAVMVGFRSDPGLDVLKRRPAGTVYVWRRSGCAPFAHDIDSRDISAGAPLIDPRDGVVIGIHTRLRRDFDEDGKPCAKSGNAMLPMNDWLERTLRQEIDSSGY